jgi:hypothetical protein
VSFTVLIAPDNFFRACGKIAALPKADFLEIAAACEPLCAFLHFCDLAIQSKFDAKAVK